jgi:putative hydrolase of the HAD superfamily
VFTLPAVENVARFLATHGAEGSPEMVERCHYHGIRAYDESPESGTSPAYLIGFLEAAGLDGGLNGELVAAIRPTGWEPAIRASLEALPELARTGVRLALVSNSDGTVERRLADAGVAQVGPGRGVTLVAAIDSAVVGIEKPDPRIFEPALTACGVGPESVVHVGDSQRADVAGALAAGIRPLHLDPFDLCPDRTHEHIHRLSEVIALVIP